MDDEDLFDDESTTPSAEGGEVDPKDDKSEGEAEKPNGGGEEEKGKEDPKDDKSEGEAKPKEDVKQDEGSTSEEPEGEGEEGSEGEDKKVPVSAIQAERKKRQAEKKRADDAEKRAKDFEERLARIEKDYTRRQAEEQSRSIPDPDKEPEKYAVYIAQQAQFQSVNDRMNFSERLARKDHGDEKVTAASQWAKDQMEKDPDFARKVVGHADPYEFIVQEYGATLGTENPGGDDTEYQQFLAWKKGQDPSTPRPAKPAAQQQDTPSAAKLPKSLAQEPSASGGAPKQLNKDGFDAEFV